MLRYNQHAFHQRKRMAGWDVAATQLGGCRAMALGQWHEATRQPALLQVSLSRQRMEHCV